MRSTHTYALIEVPQELFNNVAEQFKALGSDYAHVFMRGDNAIDLHGYAITPLKWNILRRTHDGQEHFSNIGHTDRDIAEATARHMNEQAVQRFKDDPSEIPSKFYAVLSNYILQSRKDGPVVDTSKWKREDYAKADAETIKGFARNFLGQDRDGTHSDVFQYGMAIGRGEYPYVKFREYSEAYFLISGGITIQERLIKGDVDTDWSKEQDDK